jgi:phosphatidylglycerol:prolipoprotein diacylglycerol transferase
MITYPAIDPIIVTIDIPFTKIELAVRWYGLMYVIGLGVGWWLARHRAAKPGSTWKPADVDDLIFFCAIGVIAGGRIGWALVYGTTQLIEHPLSIFRIWEGGMSFHGGLVGVMLMMLLFAKRRQRLVADVFDFAAPLPGFGLMTGRIGNFINGELWGKPTEGPWAFIVNPQNLHDNQAAEAISLCRRFDIDPCVLHVHASQLYQAALEGATLFIVLVIFTMRPRPRLAPTGLFLILYGVFRFLVEFVRVPDENRGYILFGWVTTGQILSVPMIIAGAFVMWLGYRRREPSGNVVPASA